MILLLVFSSRVYLWTFSLSSEEYKLVFNSKQTITSYAKWWSGIWPLLLNNNLSHMYLSKILHCFPMWKFSQVLTFFWTLFRYDIILKTYSQHLFNSSDFEDRTGRKWALLFLSGYSNSGIVSAILILKWAWNDAFAEYFCLIFKSCCQSCSSKMKGTW